MKDNKYRLFFITSNLAFDDSQIKIMAKSVLKNLIQFSTEKKTYKDEEFSVKMYYSEVNEKLLSENDRNRDNNTYKSEITLYALRNHYKGNINIKKDDHSFIYNLKFNNYVDYRRREFPPPKSIPLSNCYQLQYFKKTINKSEFKPQRDSLFNTLFNDSLELIQQTKVNNSNYDFDFYLELFKIAFAMNRVIQLLEIFDIRKVSNVYNREEIKKFSNILKLFESKQLEAAIRNVKEEKDKNKYKEYFYTLLLFYRYNFEKENLDKLLLNKQIWKYLVNVLQQNALFFPDLQLPEELFDEMINKTPLSFDQMESIFFYINSLEKFIHFINKNIDKIYSCCLGKNKKKKNTLKLSEFNILSKDTDNYPNIYEELNILINFEKANSQFVIFDENFWDNFIVSNFGKNLNNLLIIDKCILLCQEVDKSFKMDIHEQITKSALSMIENGELKNIELLKFLRQNKYFQEKCYASLLYRPLDILNGIDLDNINEDFFDIWNEVNIFEMYSFLENKAQKIILDKITQIKDLNIIFKLFNFTENKIPDVKNMNLLYQKYISLINTYIKDTCPNFVKDTSLLIYGLNKNNYNFKPFLENIIQKNFDSETVKEIYLYISHNYQDISRDLINCIINYFINDKNNLKLEKVTELIMNVPNDKFLKSIFNKIDKFVIKEEELFNERQDIDSFKLLKWIQEKKLIENKKELNESIYVMGTNKIKDKIQEKIKTGNIKYNMISAWYISNMDILKDKLKIILFNKEEDFKECIRSLNMYFSKMKSTIKKINKLNNVLREFYENKHKDDIKFLNDFEIRLKNGLLNELEKERTKNDLDKMGQILPDLEEKNNLKNSIFFMNFFKENKMNKKFQLKSDDEILDKTIKDFEQLRLLFDKEPFFKIEKSIIKICYEAIKSLEKEEVEKEIVSLKKYFKLENIDKLIIESITGQIIALSKKEKIFLTLKGCINFIEETKVKQTDFFKDLKEFQNNLSENIAPEKITLYGKQLEKYGINVLETKAEEQDYLNILHSLYKKKGALEFVINLKNDDCHNLQEICSETENTFVTLGDIIDMEKVSKFMKNLIGDITKKTDLELIALFKEKVQQTKNIAIIFEQYANNARQIQELYSEKLDKSQATLKKIKFILADSEFKLSIDNKSSEYFTFEGSYNDEEKNIEKIFYEELIDLRRRAMLTKKLGDDKSEEEQKIFMFNKTFAQKINEILKINNILKKIAEKGYSENITLRVQIKNSKSGFYSILDNVTFKDYEECNIYFNKIYSEISNIQKNYYRNDKTKLIRYVYGRLFILLKNYFENTSNETLDPFLKYITNDLIESNNELDKSNQYKYDNRLGNGDKYVCLLENINNFLEEFLQRNSLNLEHIYQQNLVQNKFKGEFRGLYTYFLEDDKYIQKGEEEHILNWYYFLTGNAPMAQTVLLCNEETTSEEIIAFMHRAFLCEYNAVFMVGKLNLLTPKKRQILTGLINILYIGHEKEMKSCLVFVYSDKNSTIVTYLDRIKYRKKLQHKDKKKDEQHLFNEKVQIVFSDKSGIGKSTHIKQEVEKNKKIYIHFPFGGEFSRKDVIARLKNIRMINKRASDTVIHLDLYDTKQTDLMKNFLFSFLVTKLYGQNENIFYLSKNVEIKIEIPNGFINFFYKFPILDMFENKYEMKIDKLEELIVPPEINSNMQIVCNYLKLFEEKQISEADLYIKNVSIKKEEKESYDIKVKEIDAQSLPQKECDRLIHKYIGLENPTYYQINSFINVLSGQLKKFSMNYGLTYRYLAEVENEATKMNDNNLKNIRSIRTILIDGFIKNTQHFTKGAYNDLLNSKEENYKVGVEQGIYDESKQEKIAIDVLSNQDQEQEMISFSKIKPSLIFFHENEGQEYSIISTCDKNEEEYSNLLKLKRVPALINSKYSIKEEIEIPEMLNDYRNYEHEKFLYEIQKILNIENPELNKDKNEKTEEKRLKSIEEIVGEYVFTADNFIKMILILLRIRENIPTIMMGETGCGKTSLIRKLSELTNNGVSNMKILNIHAGINDQEIVDFLKKSKDGKKPSIIEEADKLYESELKKKEASEKKDLKYYEKKLWIFLDEINTCNCMGLICELMTKHSCQGEPLPKSIIFIAACNPYRKLNNQEAFNGLEVKGTKKRELAYTVNPLPFSLLNFIFNFGKLTPKDEERYINNMIINPIERFYIEDIKKKEKKDDEKNEIKEIKDNKRSIIDYLDDDEELKKQYNELKELAKKSIVKAQTYVRDKYGNSAVSLREIRRFSIFYEFFVHYLRKKRELFKNMELNDFSDLRDADYRDLRDFDIYKYSINLSVYICYYLRLTNKSYRDEFSSEMNGIFKCIFEEIPKKEQKYIVDNIEMKEGIAKNRALLENIFSLFVCINAKVPLFIVGKPGCSKSLSVQLINKSMNSDNKIFNNLPKLILSSYQGSLGSTSEGVLQVFKAARKKLENKNNNKEDIISMVFFDEMGLAEHSKNNPLKVIHSELEYDLNEGDKKIAFVGISNWILDASKMNRGIYLSITPPDLEDLIDTAKTIAITYDDTLANKNNEFFSNLAETYFNYKEILKTNYTKNEDFHGSRDFYHLTKNSMKSLLIKAKNTRNIEIDEQVKQTTGVDSLERNFGGIEFDKEKTSLVLIKNEFRKKYEKIYIQKKYDVLKRIEENISDKQSRYLLLISKSSVSNYLLKNILSDKKINKDSSFYIGSRFVKDQQSEEYTLKILNKVQLQMEQDKVLLLADLESVYPALYDLFNQNFTVMSNKNYARIAIGSSTNTYSLVNDGFKCIILVDQNNIENEEPPFLNRFEKHIISFEYLLPKKIADEADKIYETIQNFVEMNLPEKDNETFKLNYDIKKLLVNCDKEEIQGIIYSKYKEYEIKGEDVIMQDLYDYVLEKISLTLPQDILLFMHFSGFRQKYDDILKKVITFYKKGEHNNLTKFLQKMKNTKNVIYTFTDIEKAILSNTFFETEMFGKINIDNITDIQISTLNSENELEGELENFYIKNEKKILVFRFNPEETDIMNYIKFFIENYIQEKNSFEENNINKKAFIFTIHMNRIFEADKLDIKKKKYIERNELAETISHLSDFYQIFIDDLNGEDLTFVDIMNYNQEDLFKKILNLDEEFYKKIYQIFSYFNYDFEMNIPAINQSNYSKSIIEYILSEKELTEKIKNCIIKQKKKENTDDIFYSILKNNLMKFEDVDLISVLKKFLSDLFKNNFAKFIFKSEKDHYLSPLLYNQKLNNELQKYKKEKKIQKEFKQEEKKEEINEIKTGIKEENNIINEKEIKNNADINKNKLIKALEKNYLDKFDISQTKDFNEKIKNNQINLLVGLKLPIMKNIINDIRLHIKANISEKYLINEQYIRSVDEELFMEKENKIINSLNKHRKNVEIEIKNNELLKNIEEIGKANIEDYHQFYELLTEDYYLIFLSEIIPNFKNCYNNIEDYIDILKKMINIRFSNDINIDQEINTTPEQLFSKKILWLESYSQYITIILDIYQKIVLYEEDLFDKINKIIEDKEIKYEISNRSPKQNEKINLPFFYILESLLKVINSDFDLYEKIERQKFYDFINLLKTIQENVSKVYNELVIFSKEIYTIEEFLNIQQHLNLANKSNKENLIEVLKILSEHAKLAAIVSNDEPKLNCEELCDNMNILYKFLHKNLGDTDNFAKLMSNICTEETKNIANYQYRKILVEIVLNNPKIISISTKFFSIILSKIVDTDLEAIIYNLEEIEKTNYIDYIEKISETENDVLNEMILSIFENNFNLFFESITSPDLSKQLQQRYFPKYYNYIKELGKENPTLIMVDTSLEVFQDCLNTLEKIYNNSQEEEDQREIINNELILKLYCISYIKIYLYKCIHFNNSKNKDDFLEFSKIMEVIMSRQNNFRKMIKIYIFKILFHIMDRDFEGLKDYHYEHNGLKFIDEFKESFTSKKKASLSYYLLPIEKYEDYQIIERKFEDYRYNDFGDGVKEFRDYIEANGIDDFYTISSNIIVSKLSLTDYTDDNQEYSKYSSFVNNLFDNNLKISKIKKQLFFLFSNVVDFSNKIKPKIISKSKDKIDPNLFEILLHLMRICLQTSDSEKSKEYFYSHLISNNIEKIISENCVPGNNLLNDIYVSNYMSIEHHLNTLDHDIGAYVCSCGLYYVIPPCGFPDYKDENEEQDRCLNCKEPIGHGEPKEGYTGCHSMYIRPGHLRIFKDEEHRMQEFDAYGDYDEGIPNMLLEQYKKEKIDPILEKAKFGINKVEKKYFEQMNITIRKLSIIGYRLLNLVIYSNIFFANCLGFIPDEKLNDYTSNDMTIMNIIETDWNILKDCLQTKGVQNIQVFMNMIFSKFCELLNNCKTMKTTEEREKFEDEVEKMLEEMYKKYDEYEKKYLEINEKALKLEKNSMKSLMLEIIDENKYDEKNFPFYKLLFMTTYPSLDNFKHELQKIPNYEKKYPLLYYSLIDKNNNKELIRYLPEFNDFINFMIDKYSYKISRDEASKMILKEQDIYKNNQQGFKKKFEKFIEIWDKIKNFAVKYKCNPDMLPENLDEDKTLDYFLNDNAEIGKGMYIASALQNFISWQNNFLDKLIDNLKNGGILHHFVENMKKTIDVQNATKNDVLDFEELNKCLNEKIYENSKRNIFKMDNKVSYQNYRQYIYDFDSMERTLGKILLTGKVKFNDENKLKFITYCFEGFRGNKSSVFIDFINLYKTVDLSNETKQKIYNKLSHKIKNKSNDLQKILFSIQLIIYYLTQDVRKGQEEIEINVIIKELPEYVNLNTECINFFKEQNFKINELTAIYSYFELLCFQTIELNLNEYYKKPIDEKTKENILKAFEKEEKQIIILNKINLATACRKLISRYLVSLRGDTDLNEKNKLFDYLIREELWSKEDWKNIDLIQTDLEILNKNNIIVGQCYELYKLLGGDEKEALRGIDLNAKDDEEDEEDDFEDRSKIVKRIRRYG